MSEEKKSSIGVGIGVLIINDQKQILLGKRKNAHGEGTWSGPGGHLDFGESWEDCAKREVMEEVGIEIGNVRFGSATNDIFLEEGKHYITIFMVADYISGEVTVCEPDKCESWEWFDFDNLPSPLVLWLQNLLKTGFNPRLK